MVTPNVLSLSPRAREALWQALGAAVTGDASSAAQVLLQLEAGESQQVLEVILTAYSLALLEVDEAETDRDSLQLQLDAVRDELL